NGAPDFARPPTQRVAPAGAASSARSTPCSSTGPAAATATTTRRGCCARRWGHSCGRGPRPSPRRGSSLREDCLFCRLAREGDHVLARDGFVAVHDINPRAETHLLVIPE